MSFITRNPPKKIKKVKKNKCEIVIERTPRGIRKRIIGDCTSQQLKALEGQKDLSDET